MLTLCPKCSVAHAHRKKVFFLSTNPRVEHEKQAQRNTGDSSYTGEKTETCEHLKTQGEDHIVSSPRNRAVACRENRQTAPFRQWSDNIIACEYNERPHMGGWSRSIHTTYECTSSYFSRHSHILISDVWF